MDGGGADGRARRAHRRVLHDADVRAPQTPLATDDDTVHAETSTLALIIFGGQGNDTIFGGKGGDIIFGDRGRVIAGGNVFGNGGLGDTTDGLATPVNRIQSADAWVGGNDTITTQGADDVLIGGSGADTIVAGGGSEHRPRRQRSTSTSRLQTIATTDPTFGGNDTITAGAGHDVLLGGTGADTIVAGGGDDMAWVTTA